MLLGHGKASKVKKFVLEIDNYDDVQRPERDNKVSKAVTFVLGHVLEWWTSKNA
jgi:c-di-AMP phosphodiesterase-like protein